METPQRKIKSTENEITNMKLSEARQEKNTESLKAEQAQQKQIEKIGCNIRFLLKVIENNKESVEDCMRQGYWSFAKAAIVRIENAQEKIYHLKGKISHEAWVEITK